MSFQSGLSLLELMVTLVVATAATYIVGSAFPVVREQQSLQQARQQFTSHLRAAQVQALDEQRHPDCLSRVGDSLPRQKLCSDVGVSFEGNGIRTFADVHDNDRFDNEDFVLATAALPAGITADVPFSLVFESTPPNVRTFFNGLLITAASPAAVSLRSPHREVQFTVSAYGLVE